MTVPSRYRGQPVSEGIGLGQIYHGDPGDRINGHRQPATEDEVRAAFAAVARDRPPWPPVFAREVRTSRPRSWTSPR